MWLKLLNDLREAGSEPAVNDALKRIQDQARSDFITVLAMKLASLPQHGPDGVLEDAEALLNDLLFKLYRHASLFRGTSDAEAQAWARRILERTLIDTVRTPRRRGTVWNSVLSYLRGRAERQHHPARPPVPETDSGES